MQNMFACTLRYTCVCACMCVVPGCGAVVGGGWKVSVCGGVCVVGHVCGGVCLWWGMCVCAWGGGGGGTGRDMVGGGGGGSLHSCKQQMSGE